MKRSKQGSRISKYQMRLKMCQLPQLWKSQMGPIREKPKWRIRKYLKANRCRPLKIAKYNRCRLLNSFLGEIKPRWIVKSRWSCLVNHWISNLWSKKRSKQDKGYLVQILVSDVSKRTDNRRVSHVNEKKLTLKRWKWNSKWCNRKMCSCERLTKTWGNVKRYPSFQTLDNLTISLTVDRSSMLS